jgi:hypothetical protein
MVSGLIKHQNFGVAEKYFGNGDTHSPASRESFAFLFEILFLETNSFKNLHSFALSLIGLNELKSLLNLRDSGGFSSNLFLGLFLVIVLVHELLHFFHQFSSLDVTVEDVLENSLLVSFNFLLNL